MLAVTRELGVYAFYTIYTDDKVLPYLCLDLI